MNQVVTELVIDSRGAEVGSASYVRAMQVAQRAVDQLRDRQDALANSSAENDARMLTAATSTARAASAYDRLKASIDPVFAAAKGLERDLLTLDRAVTRLGVSEGEAARMMELLTLKHDAGAAAARRQADEYLRLAAAGREAFAADQAQARFNQFLGIGRSAGSARDSADVFMSAGPAGAGGNRLSSTQLQQATYQANDVLTMLALGAPMTQIAASQGGQIFQLLQQNEGGVRGSLTAIKEGAVDAAGAVGRMLGPIGLAATGLTALGGVAYLAFRSTREEAVDLEDALGRQKSLLDELRNRYGLVEDAAKRAFSISPAGDRFRVADNARELEFLIREQSQGLLDTNSAWRRSGGLGLTADFDARTGATTFGVRGEFSDFADEILRFRETIAAGNPEVEKFRAAVLERWNLAPNRDELTATVRKLLDLTTGLNDVANAYRDVEAVRRQMEARQRGPLIGSEDERARDSYLDRQREFMRETQRAYDRAMLEIRARSPDELAAVARASEEAKSIEGENDVARRQRIDLAGRQALAQAEYEIAEAQRERVRSYQEAIEAQRLDLELIGRTSGDTARLRMEYELTARVREEAARSGIAADEAELGMIRRKAAELGALVDAVERARLNDDLDFERDQMFRSPLDRTIASRLRGTGIGLESREAERMREMHRFGEARDLASGFLSDFKSTLLRNGGDIGDAFAKSLLNAFSKSMDKSWEDIFDSLATAFASALTGQRAAPIGVASDAAAKAASAVLSTSNDNYAPGAVTRAPLGAARGAFDLASRLTPDKAASHVEGLSDRFGSALGSAFENAPDWVRDGTNIYSGFRSVERQSQLFDAAVSKYGSVAAARKWVAPPGRSQHNFGNAADLRFGSDQVRDWWHENAGDYGLKFPMKHEPWHIEAIGGRGGNQAAAALEKLAGSANTATEGLGTLGSGLGQLGQSLAGAFPAAPGTAGESSWGWTGMLGKILKPIWGNMLSPAAWGVVSSGGMTGLYHEGGIAGFPSQMRSGVDPRVFIGAPRYHTGGIAGDEVPAILRRGEPVFKSMAHAREVVGGQTVHFAPVFQVDARGSTMTRAEFEAIAKQQSEDAVGRFNLAQTRGGIAETQRRFNSQKG